MLNDDIINVRLGEAFLLNAHLLSLWIKLGDKLYLVANLLK